MSKETKKSRSNVFVSPGDMLGVIEEFIPMDGTYVEDGNVYSAIVGKSSFDMNKREVSVKPRTRQPLIPKDGDIIIGKVTNVHEKTLTLMIIQIGDIQISVPFTGIMHISDVRRGYVKTMEDVFKVGDIIRAKVISTKNRENHLSTQNDSLGVIQASCIYCGGLLARQKNKLICTQCNRTNYRKFATDYGES